MTNSSRLIIVSNRLPITLRPGDDGTPSIVRSSGGLATALGPWHAKHNGLWVGWSGLTDAPTGDGGDAARQHMIDNGFVPVELNAQEAAGYYEDFSNGVLWPLFHYLLDRVPVAEHDWLTYQRVNEKFADAVAAHCRPGDQVWVHDYHLMLVPQMLRKRRPDIRIGFFLHVPFPSSEVFRILPWRTEILEGVLGADLIGFHTYAYLRHFAMSVLHTLGIEPDVDRVFYGRRAVHLKALPVGVDAGHFAAIAAEPEVRAAADRLRQESGGRRILLGVDRLDYTKGLPRRLLAVRRLLDMPQWRDRVRFIQIAVPTRSRVESYRGFRRTVEQLVGRINGAFGTVESVPIHYLHQSVSVRRLVTLFLAADVMVVTPLRDGLNLVAKEFVASRIDDDGVLVLSEFAGASTELGESIIVNPYDVDGLAQSLESALLMSPPERSMRMRALRSRVLVNTVERWAADFLEALAGIPDLAAGSRLVEPLELERALAPLLETTLLALVLDYDGTLVPIQPTAALASPDEELLSLLRQLASAPGLSVHVVSGRPRDTLQQWFGDLPIALWAEHGFWHRAAPGMEWTGREPLPDDWDHKVRSIIDHFTASTPGSWVEQKSSSLTWHYRLADPEFGARQAHEVRMLLGDALSNQPLEVREGKKVLELRPRGVHKGNAITQILAASPAPAAIIAVGDDSTDEDMFAALPPAGAAGVHVGREPSQASHSLTDPAALRQWLRLLLVRRHALVEPADVEG